MKDSFKKLALILLSVIICVLIIELVLCFFKCEPLKAFLNDTRGRNMVIKESKNKDLVYELTPMANCYAWNCHVRINSDGFRDADYPLEKKASHRIIVLGDSITFGIGMSAGKTYAKVLERLYYERKGENIEVINMGCGGYNIRQNIALLKEKGLKYVPDTVIYCYSQNDLMDTSPNLDYIKKHIYINTMPLNKLRVSQYISIYLYRNHLIKWLKQSSRKHLNPKYGYICNNREDLPVEQNVRVIRHLLEKHSCYISNNHQIMASYRKTPNIRLPYYTGSYVLNDSINMLDIEFGKLQEMSVKNGFRVIVLIVPELLEQAGINLRENIHGIISHFAMKKGFIVIDMHDVFQIHGFEKLRQYNWDTCHPNSAGHRIIAEILYHFLDYKKIWIEKNYSNTCSTRN